MRPQHLLILLFLALFLTACAPAPTPTAAPTRTQAPALPPTATPAPTAAPTATPTPEPTNTPTVMPATAEDMPSYLPLKYASLLAKYLTGEAISEVNIPLAVKLREVVENQTEFALLPGADSRVRTGPSAEDPTYGDDFRTTADTSFFALGLAYDVDGQPILINAEGQPDQANGSPWVMFEFFDPQGERQTGWIWTGNINQSWENIQQELKFDSQGNPLNLEELLAQQTTETSTDSIIAEPTVQTSLETGDSTETTVESVSELTVKEQLDSLISSDKIDLLFDLEAESLSESDIENILATYHSQNEKYGEHEFAKIELQVARYHNLDDSETDDLIFLYSNSYSKNKKPVRIYVTPQGETLDTLNSKDLPSLANYGNMRLYLRPKGLALLYSQAQSSSFPPDSGLNPRAYLTDGQWVLNNQFIENQSHAYRYTHLPPEDQKYLHDTITVLDHILQNDKRLIEICQKHKLFSDKTTPGGIFVNDPSISWEGWRGNPTVSMMTHEIGVTLINLDFEEYDEPTQKMGALLDEMLLRIEGHHAGKITDELSDRSNRLSHEAIAYMRQHYPSLKTRPGLKNFLTGHSLP